MRKMHDVKASGTNGASGYGRPLVLTFGSATELAPVAVRPWPWFAGKPWAMFLATLYPLLVVAPLAIFVALNPQSDRPLTAEVGIDCAVVGFTIIAMQFVTVARLKWVEAPFGL